LTKNDLISVIIPHAGKVEPLRECYHTLRKSHLIVDQPLDKILGPAVPYEVIIVTDQPSRETRELLQAHDDIVPIVNDELVGPQVALNQGLKAAKGNYLMFLSTDVRLFGGALLIMRNALRKRPKMGWVALPCKQTGFFAGCSMWTREAFEKVGLFDEGYVSGGGFADDDYLRRMWLAGYYPSMIRSGKQVEHVESDRASTALLGEEKKKEAFDQCQALFKKKWGQTGTNWDLLPVYVPPAESFREAWIHSQVSPEDTILELGCAENPVWRNTLFKVTTSDISERPDEDCKPDIVCDAAAVPKEDKSFDVVCADELLEHVDDPLAVLREAVRLARYKVVITVPNEWEWPAALKPFTNPGHKRFFTRSDLEELLKTLGWPFKIEDIIRDYWWHFGAVITVEEKIQKLVCLNLGSFVDTIAGEHWMNIDILPLRAQIPAAINFLQADLTQGLPMYALNSVDVIRASHILEHLPLGPARILLAECYRVLKPGGVLRLAVPDLEIMIRKYRGGEMDWINADQPMEYVLAPTAGEKFSRLMFSGDNEHKAIYDYGMLENFLNQAGFQTVVRSAQGFSHSETLQQETKDQHPEISLYVEAIK
jgi:predicted SAM-dependent methyltransferase